MPYQLQFRLNRSLKDWEDMKALQLVLEVCRQSWPKNSQCFCQDHGAFRPQFVQDALQCNASPQVNRRQRSRSFLVHQPKDSGEKTPAPFSPSSHKPRYRRADGTYQALHRRFSPTFYMLCCAPFRVRAFRRERGGEPV